MLLQQRFAKHNGMLNQSYSHSVWISFYQKSIQGHTNRAEPEMLSNLSTNETVLLLISCTGIMSWTPGDSNKSHSQTVTGFP